MQVCTYEGLTVRIANCEDAGKRNRRCREAKRLVSPVAGLEMFAVPTARLVRTGRLLRLSSGRNEIVNVGRAGPISTVIADAQEHPLIFGLACAAVVAAVLVSMTRWSLRRTPNAARQPVAFWGAGLVSASFIFTSTFVAVTVWQIEQAHDRVLVKEFSEAIELASEVIWSVEVGRLDQSRGDRVLDGLTAYGAAVARDEIPQVTGLPDAAPLRGSADAVTALRQVSDALTAIDDDVNSSSSAAKSVRPDQMGQMWQAWRALHDARVERLSYHEPIPAAVLAIMAVTGLSATVLIGALPSGNDTVVRWLVATLCGIVIVVISTGIMVLSYPGLHEEQGLASVEMLNEVITTRP